MSENEIREPIQQRSIKKKEDIIKAGFTLFAENGYYNTNTAEIAKSAGVSTGIVYQYFKDKHDILISSLEKYADNICYPTACIANTKFNKDNIENSIKEMILKFIENHKLSPKAHEEIMAMTHLDKDVAQFFCERELYATNIMVETFSKQGITTNNLQEKVHIALNLIDNLCHEIVYHQHEKMNYDIMIDIVTSSISNLLK